MSEPARPTADEVLASAANDFLVATRVALDGFDALAEPLAAHLGAAERLLAFRKELHRLNGSAATFGFPRAGRMAAAMEVVVKQWMNAPGLDGARRAGIVAGFARALRAEFAADVHAPRAPSRRLLLVGAKDAVAVGLTAEAAARGYVVERVADDELDEAIEDGVPYAMIAPEPAPAREALVRTLTIELAAGDPVVTVADRPTFRRVTASDAAAVLDALNELSAAARAACGPVLVLDDDPVMQALAGVAAGQANLDVRTVGDVAAFRAELQRCIPLFVVVDVEIGDTNGIDLVREVRAQSALAAVPVLVLSGRDDEETRQAALAAGAAEYLRKPVSVLTLASTLSAWSARTAS